MSSEKKSYIGSVLSVISKAGIRYVGTLVMIDSQNQTLTLQSVRSYGSEGRRGETKEVPPSDDIYEFIIFKASDLKEFNVVKPPEKSDKEFQDPAIVETKQKEEEKPEKEYTRKDSDHSRSYRKPSYRGYRKHYDYAPKEKVNSEDLKEKYKDDFDFDSMNKKLIKEEAKVEEVGFKYDKKKSFFDNISTCEKKNQRYDRDTLKKIDSETFGEFESGRFRRSGRGGYRRPRRRGGFGGRDRTWDCLLYTSPSPRDS